MIASVGAFSWNGGNMVGDFEINNYGTSVIDGTESRIFSSGTFSANNGLAISCSGTIGDTYCLSNSSKT